MTMTIVDEKADGIDDGQHDDPDVADDDNHDETCNGRGDCRFDTHDNSE